MAIRIDDEAEPADVVFVDRDEEPALLDIGATFATRRGDALDESLLLLRRDC